MNRFHNDYNNPRDGIHAPETEPKKKERFGAKMRKGIHKLINSPRTRIRGSQDERQHTMNFHAREAFNKIRINIDVTNTDKQCILIASADRSEGRTTICTSMARYFAEFGGNTILVDCNTRIPKIGSLFGIPHEMPGLGDYLMGQIDYHQCIHETDTPYLYVMSAGARLPDPVGILGSDRMGQLLHRLLQEYDHVVLDTPAILFVPDAISLAKHPVSVYMVVRHQYTKKRDLIGALEALKLVNCEAKGIIYNDLTMLLSDYRLSYYSDH